MTPFEFEQGKFIDILIKIFVAVVCHDFNR